MPTRSNHYAAKWWLIHRQLMDEILYSVEWGPGSVRQPAQTNIHSLRTLNSRWRKYFWGHWWFFVVRFSVKVSFNAMTSLAELIDRVVVLRPTRHKISHFGDVPQANLLPWYGKKLNLTQQKYTLTNQKKCTTTEKWCNRNFQAY